MVARAGLLLLAVLTCVACTVLLTTAYRSRRDRLLLWSALCFAGLSVNNVLLFIDLILVPTADLRVLRLVAALGGMGCLLYGFIWDLDR
jgi:hypothetical protein